MTTITDINTDRDAVILRIRQALKQRSNKSWSVTGDRGTAWGWITINATPARRTWSHRIKADASPAKMPEDYEEYDAGKPGGHTGPSDRAELATLLGLDSVHHQGVSIAASHDYYREYVQRSEGNTPQKIAQPYWD